MPPFFFMVSCPRVYSDPYFSTLIPWRGKFSLLSDTLPLRCSNYMPSLSIPYFCISTILLSVISLVITSYCSWYLNICCTMPPHVIHTRYNHCAYICCILWIKLFFLCIIEQEIWVSAFFKILCMHMYLLPCKSPRYLGKYFVVLFPVTSTFAK